jgi:hypothetical protein
MTGANRAGFSFRASGKHPQRSELDSRKAARDQAGQPTWEMRPESEAEDWTAMWQRSVDPLDPREDIRICRWPNQWLRDQLAKAEMQAGESSAE